MLLEDKVAIVSGIGPGMGRSIALKLALQGADIVLAARTTSKLEEVAKEIEALGRKATRVPTDLAKLEDCRALVERAVEVHGKLDILVNNASHLGTGRLFEKDDLEAGWRDTLEVNLYGSLRVTQAAIAPMRANGGGSIVMINTMSMRKVNPTFTAYAASKAALHAATQGMARELGSDQIRVNSVMPGYIMGEAVANLFVYQAKKEGISEDDAYQRVAANIPLGRIPTPDEIAGAVVFFASDLASCITGQSLDVNGGHVMY
jgi:NAD(P)-dependent dehydrogenase (short-subunit alcohol dehydrogenase family)